MDDLPPGSRSSRRRSRRIRLVIAAVAAAVAVAFVGGTAIAWVALTQAADAASADERPVARPLTTPLPAGTVTPAPGKAARRTPDTVTVAAVGDMIFGRQVAELMEREGAAAPLANVAPLLASADLAFGNLESPLSDGGEKATWKDYTLRGEPRAIEGLRLAGFDALSLANNHMFDYGWDAARDTVEGLGAARIGHTGAGADAKAAWTPVVATPRGDTVAVLAFTRVLPSGFAAGRSHPGVANGYDTESVLKAVREAKRLYGLVIVSFHWGEEFKDRPNGGQVELGRAAVDAGADLVLGHHPHVIQPLEIYQGRLIAYSLGDFVFDAHSPKADEAFILNAELGPHGVGEVSVTPVKLDGYGRPSVAQGAVAERILGRLKKLSAERKTHVRVRDDRARVVR